MTNPLNNYLNALMTRCEQSMPVFRPECPECGQPITGESYNGRCGPCARQIAREDMTAIENHWREVTSE